MKKLWFFGASLFLMANNVYTEQNLKPQSSIYAPRTLRSSNCEIQEPPPPELPSDDSCQDNCYILASQGLSFDFGGQYTWMAFTTPPTFSGNTGGVHARLTYQKVSSFFGQLRSICNLGKLHSSGRSSRETESYTELLGGYSFRLSEIGENYLLSLTPYIGLGLDFLTDRKSSYGSISSIKLNYQLYYALIGFDLHYLKDPWSFGMQMDCFPSFEQYLSIGGLTGAAWKMNQRTGFAIRFPIAYKLPIERMPGKPIWFELTPYYRLLPIGASSVLGLPSRNLHQWGAFFTFRFFI